MSWLVPALQLFALLVLPIAALAGLIDFIVGRPQPTRPICPRCRHSLPFAVLVEAAPCPGCATPQEDAPPDILVRRPHWPGLLVFLLGAGLATGALLLGTRLAPRGPVLAMAASARSLSNDRLIAGAVRANHPMDGHVTELARRLRDGTCRRSEVRGTLDGVSAAQAGNPSALRRIASLAALDPTISAEERSRWLESVADRIWPSTLDWVGLSSDEPTLRLADDRSASSDDPLSRLVFFESAELDGGPLETAALRRPLLIAAPGRSSISGVPLAARPERGGSLVIHGEARYYSRSAWEVLEFVQFDLPPDAWPEPVARHPVRLEATIDPIARP